MTMHTGYDPQQLYEDWQASGLSFEDFMVGVKQQGTEDPWLAGQPPINQSQSFYDEQTANFKIYGGGDIPSRDDYLRRHGMQPKEPPIVPDTAQRQKEIEHELDIIRGRIPTPKGYQVNAGRVKELMTELRHLKRKT